MSSSDIADGDSAPRSVISRLTYSAGRRQRVNVGPIASSCHQFSMDSAARIAREGALGGV